MSHSLVLELYCYTSNTNYWSWTQWDQTTTGATRSFFQLSSR